MGLGESALRGTTTCEMPSFKPQCREGWGLPGSQMACCQDQMTDLLTSSSLTGGKDAALDFTVVNPLQAALVQGASQEGGSAVDHGHRAKCRKYEDSRRGVRGRASPSCPWQWIPWGAGTLLPWTP